MIPKKQIAINLFTNILAMSISTMISLLITPYLINKMGFAAYGYIGIIGSFISFMSVITYTLTSMVARFLTVSLNRDGPAEASKYMSSALFMSIFIGVLLFPLILFLSSNLNKLINLEQELAGDVQLAFVLSGLAFILTSISTVFYTGSYNKNRLDIGNGINILSNTVRVIILVALFSFFRAKIWHYAIASLLQVLILIILRYISFKILLPNISFNIKLFNLKMSLELLSSGFFNSIIMLGATFLSEIDLIVGNRYLSAEIVGMYAAATMIPSAIVNIASALSFPFSPTTVILYSTGKIHELRVYTNNVVKFCGLMIGWPVAIVSGLAMPILKIWLGKDYSSYQIIILLMLLPLTINLAVSQLYIVQQATNRVKIPALASIILGIMNILLSIFFTATLKMGIFGIVLSGVMMSTLRTFVFMPLYTAFITDQPKLAYYKGLIIPFLITLATCTIGLGIQKYLSITTLLSVLWSAIILSIFYLTISAGSLNQEEREMIQKQVVSFIRKVDLKAINA